MGIPAFVVPGGDAVKAEKITVLCKVPRQQSGSGLDEWHKAVLSDCIYKRSRATNVNNTTVSMSQIYTVLIPFDDRYMPYDQWYGRTDKQNTYTVSQGDYIVFGEVAEEVTPDTIRDVLDVYPNHCTVRSIDEVEQTHGARYRLKVQGV